MKILNKQILFGILMIFLFTISNTIASVFPDVPESYEYSEAVEYAYNNNIINGYRDNSFGPYDRINRGQITKIIINSLYSEEEIDECISNNFFAGADDGIVFFSNIFPDVTSGARSAFPPYDISGGHTFSKYICIAKVDGIVNGYTDGYFYPDSDITAAEAMKIISNAFGYTRGMIPDPNHKFQIYIEALESRNAIPVTITSLDYKIQRGEFVEIVYRLLENITSKQSTNYSELTLLSLNFDSDKWSYTGIDDYQGNIVGYNNLYLLGEGLLNTYTNTMIYVDRGAAFIIDPVHYKQDNGVTIAEFWQKSYCSFDNNIIPSSIRNSLEIGEKVIDIDSNADLSKSKVIIDFSIGPEDYIVDTLSDFYRLPGVQVIPVFGAGEIEGGIDQEYAYFYGISDPTRAILCEKNLDGYYEVRLAAFGLLDATDSYDAKYNFTQEMISIMQSY